MHPRKTKFSTVDPLSDDIPPQMKILNSYTLSIPSKYNFKINGQLSLDNVKKKIRQGFIIYKY